MSSLDLPRLVLLLRPSLSGSLDFSDVSERRSIHAWPCWHVACCCVAGWDQTNSSRPDHHRLDFEEAISMDQIFTAINAALCGIISLGLIGAILSHRVKDGVIIKTGLILLAVGFAAISARLLDGVTVSDVMALERALFLVSAGLSIVILGYLRKKSNPKKLHRRESDFVEMDQAELSKVHGGHK